MFQVVQDQEVARAPQLLRQAHDLVTRYPEVSIRVPRTLVITTAELNTLMKTEDTLEGIASFEEKRRPVWKNK